MPVVNEETFELLCLLDELGEPYEQCLDLAREALDRHPPTGRLTNGVGAIAEEARAELAVTLREVIEAIDHPEVQDHLQKGCIYWRDVAREFIADLL